MAEITLHLGDCLEVMVELPENSVDTILTDPPYGLTFMGKDWDRGVPGVAFWEQALRVAKPGAMLLAMGGTRTFHRLGSGTTGCAAVLEGRDFIGIELNPEYLAIAERRIKEAQAHVPLPLEADWP